MEFHRHNPDGRVRVLEFDSDEQKLLSLPEEDKFVTSLCEDLEGLPLVEKYKQLQLQLRAMSEDFMYNGTQVPQDHQEVLQAMVALEKICRLLAACGLPYTLNISGPNQ